MNTFILQLNMYAMLCPTKAERGQPHIAILMLFDEVPMPALDDLARDSVALQFHVEPLGNYIVGGFEDETSNEDHEGSGDSGNGEESGADKSGERECEDSEDHNSGDSDGDRVRRSGVDGDTFYPLRA